MRFPFKDHILTHHHVIVDRLVRIALGVMVLVLIGGGVALRAIDARRTVRVAIVASDRVVIGHAADMVVDLENGSKTRAVVVTIAPDPGMALTTIDNEPYPEQGTISLDRFALGAHVRFTVEGIAHQEGMSGVRVTVRDADSGAVLARAVHSVAIERPVLEVDVSARYYSREGEQLGRGPLPPRVGESTMYYVMIRVPYTGEQWQSVEVSADLGPYAAWADFVPQESAHIRYDKATRRVVWRMAEWPIVDDLAPQDIGASFGIVLTPTRESVGSAPILLTNIRASGMSEAGTRIDTAIPPITTEITNDSKGQGNGTVVP